MTLIKRRNGDLFPSLRSNLSGLLDVDRFFNEPFSQTPLTLGRTYANIPATNIKETDDEFIVELAAPGMKKKDFQVDIDNNLLKIKVEKEEEKDNRARYTCKEYDYNAFYRSFNLPESVKSEKIKAEYENGILQIHLPKVAAAIRKPAKEIAVL